MAPIASVMKYLRAGERAVIAAMDEMVWGHPQEKPEDVSEAAPDDITVSEEPSSAASDTAEKDRVRPAPEKRGVWLQGLFLRTNEDIPYAYRQIEWEQRMNHRAALLAGEVQQKNRIPWLVEDLGALSPEDQADQIQLLNHWNYAKGRWDIKSGKMMNGPKAAEYIQDWKRNVWREYHHGKYRQAVNDKYRWSEEDLVYKLRESDAVEKLGSTESVTELSDTGTVIHHVDPNRIVYTSEWEAPVPDVPSDRFFKLPERIPDETDVAFQEWLSNAMELAKDEADDTGAFTAEMNRLVGKLETAAEAYIKARGGETGATPTEIVLLAQEADNMFAETLAFMKLHPDDFEPLIKTPHLTAAKPPYDLSEITEKTEAEQMSIDAQALEEVQANPKGIAPPPGNGDGAGSIPSKELEGQVNELKGLLDKLEDPESIVEDSKAMSDEAMVFEDLEIELADATASGVIETEFSLGPPAIALEELLAEDLGMSPVVIAQNIAEMSLIGMGDAGGAAVAGAVVDAAQAAAAAAAVEGAAAAAGGPIGVLIGLIGIGVYVGAGLIINHGHGVFPPRSVPTLGSVFDFPLSVNTSEVEWPQLRSDCHVMGIFGDDGMALYAREGLRDLDIEGAQAKLLTSDHVGKNRKFAKPHNMSEEIQQILEATLAETEPFIPARYAKGAQIFFLEKA